MIGDPTRLGSVRVRLQRGLTPNGFIMAAKKRSRSKGGRAKRAGPAASHFSIVLSTTARSFVNMTVTAVTSGSVLLCLLAASDFCEPATPVARRLKVQP
jgi:hypothetical protein